MKNLLHIVNIILLSSSSSPECSAFNFIHRHICRHSCSRATANTPQDNHSTIVNNNCHDHSCHLCCSLVIDSKRKWTCPERTPTLMSWLCGVQRGSVRSGTESGTWLCSRVSGALCRRQWKTSEGGRRWWGWGSPEPWRTGWSIHWRRCCPPRRSARRGSSQNGHWGPELYAMAMS